MHRAIPHTRAPHAPHTPHAPKAPHAPRAHPPRAPHAQIDNAFYQLPEGRVKAACWDGWRERHAPKCVHCDRGVLGPHYPVEGGRLHIDCWEGYAGTVKVASLRCQIGHHGLIWLILKARGCPPYS